MPSKGNVHGQEPRVQQRLQNKLKFIHPIVSLKIYLLCLMALVGFQAKLPTPPFVFTLLREVIADPANQTGELRT